MTENSYILLNKKDLKKFKSDIPFENISAFDFNIDFRVIEKANLIIYIDDYRYRVLKSRHFNGDVNIGSMSKLAAIEYCMEQKDYWNTLITKILRRKDD